MLNAKNGCLRLAAGEMDYIRGKSRYGGKISIKKFIDALMIEADRN